MRSEKIDTIWKEEENRIEQKGGNLLGIEKKWAYIKKCVMKTVEEPMNSIKVKYGNDCWEYTSDKTVKEKTNVRDT